MWPPDCVNLNALQEVGERGRQHRAIRRDRQPGLNRHRERHVAGDRLELRRDADFFEQHVQRGRFAPRVQAGGQSDIGERAIDEVAKTLQAAIEHRAGGAGDGTVAAFDRGIRQGRGVQQVPKLVRERPQALVQGPRALLGEGRALAGGRTRSRRRRSRCRGSD